MEPDVCHDYVAILLTEEIDSLAQLESVLLQEHEILGAYNLAAIRRIAAARQERIAALARSEEQRRSLCVLHGHEPDRLGLERLLHWCDPDGVLLAQLHECAQRARRCRDLNNRNGALVAARMKHVAGLLSVLNSRDGRARIPADQLSSA